MLGHFASQNALIHTTNEIVVVSWWSARSPQPSLMPPKHGMSGRLNHVYQLMEDQNTMSDLKTKSTRASSCV